MTPNFLVGLQTKRYNGDEAKGKPFPALHDAAAEVAAVLALYGYVLGAAELGCEGVCSAGEEEEHCGGL